jgi:hypothetical protein
LFSKFISGVGPRTILAVPLRQQADETFYVRLHFAGDGQAEFPSRAALPEFENFAVARIATRPLFAGGIFIDLNDGRAFSQFQHLAERISRAYI